MMMLYELVDEYHLNWGTEEGRNFIYNYCRDKDQAFCRAMIYSIIEEELPKWQEAEREFAEHPENFVDLTLYDEQGIPYVQDDGLEYHMPNKSYSDFLSSVSFAENDLTFFCFDNFYMLLNARKFVKRIVSE